MGTRMLSWDDSGTTATLGAVTARISTMPNGLTRWVVSVNFYREETWTSGMSVSPDMARTEAEGAMRRANTAFGGLREQQYLHAA